MKTIILLTVLLVCPIFTGFSQTPNEESFEYCPDLNVWPYYRFNDMNTRSFPEIKEYFQEDYSELKASKLKNNTGILTIQFKINCNGETGVFRAYSCDLNYKTFVINPKISDYFLQKAKKLTGWKKLVDTDGQPANGHKFYSFRIVNGEITEILPK